MEKSMRHEFNRLLVRLLELEPGTEEYAAALEQLRRFSDITKVSLKGNEGKVDKFLSNPALIGVVGNLMGIFLILNYERAEIITSRAINFIRPK